MDLILVLSNLGVIFHLDYWCGAFHLNIQPTKSWRVMQKEIHIWCIYDKTDTLCNDKSDPSKMMDSSKISLENLHRVIFY